MTQKEIWSEIQRITAQRDTLADILHDVITLYEDQREEYGPLGVWLQIENRYPGLLAKAKAALEGGGA
jgi:hypothetical protein